MTSTQSAAQIHASVDAVTSGGSASVEVLKSPAATQTHLMPSEEGDRGSGRVRLIKPFAASKSRRTKAKQPVENHSLRLIAIGSRQTIINNMKMLHMLKYAEIGDWSKLQRGPNPGEFMSVLTLRSPRPWIS